MDEIFQNGNYQIESNSNDMTGLDLQKEVCTIMCFRVWMYELYNSLSSNVFHMQRTRAFSQQFRSLNHKIETLKQNHYFCIFTVFFQSHFDIQATEL